MKNHRFRPVRLLAVVIGMLLVPLMSARAEDEPVFAEFQDSFPLFGSPLSATGVNDYFMPLIPGYALYFEGENDEGEMETLLIRVLRRTRVVAGVRCAIVQEIEKADGELVEISWNYFAIARDHDSIFYFGEEVDIYEDGEVVSHDGAWLAGKGGARFGLQMPGYPTVGSRYYQEIAPGIALDRAEHLSVTESLVTPAGTFRKCLLVEETTPLEPGEFSYKYYAPGVGLIKDGPLELVAYGFCVKVPASSEGED